MIKHGLFQKYNDGLRKLSVCDYLYHASQKTNKIITIKYEKSKEPFFISDFFENHF